MAWRLISAGQRQTEAFTALGCDPVILVTAISRIEGEYGLLDGC
jgi:hypothetical protein